MALEKSNNEYRKYNDTQKVIEQENSLKELETDIDTLKKQLPDGNAAEYFEEKAQKGSRKKFGRVLSKVSKRDPLEFDKK